MSAPETTAGALRRIAADLDEQRKEVLELDGGRLLLSLSVIADSLELLSLRVAIIATDFAESEKQEAKS